MSATGVSPMPRDSEKSRTSEELTQLAARIRRNRDAAGMSQRELARRASLSLDAVHRIEHGTRQPTLKTFLDLASALGTTPVELLGGPSSGRRFKPAVERLAIFLESQPDKVVEAVDKCARAVAELPVHTS